MKNKRLLTLDDLCKYFSSEKQNLHFCASDENKNIIVQTPGTITFSKADDNEEGLVRVRLQSCHIGKNRNGSNISEQSMKKAMKSFRNRPILGFIHEVDGTPQFYTHNMHIDDNDELVYDEYPVGHIPESCNARLEYVDEYDKTYLFVDGYIYEAYSKAAEILEREGECACSVELEVRELSYDSTDKVLNLDNFFFSGVTILGVDEEGNKIGPGMAGSNITLADFSKTNNSLFSDKMIELLEGINDKLSNFNITNKKGGDLVKFEELLKKYNVTVEDIDFEYEDMSDEELEQKFEEVFGEEAGEGEDPEPTPGENFDDTDGGETTEEDPAAEDEPAEGDPTEENPTEEEPEEEASHPNTDDTDDGEDEAQPAKKLTIDYAVTFNGTTQNFSITLTDQLNALCELVNSTYGEVDGDWYSVDADADRKLVYMFGWTGSYRQSYKVKNGVFSLVGDRVKIVNMWVTEDEKKEFENMKSNYSSIQDELNNYKSEPEKLAVLNSDDYKNISDSKEFAELKQRDTYFEMTVDEVRKKADAILLAYAKNNPLNFAHEDKKDVGFKPLFSGKKKTSRYGNLI